MTNKSYVTLVPAYGKDYKSKKEVLEAWKKGKDFLIQSIGHRFDGRYINKTDAKTSEPNTTWHIRYKKLGFIAEVWWSEKHGEWKVK